MPASFRNPVYAQVGMFLAILVTVRLYYALIEANTATLSPWITSTNSRLITLHLLAIPAATLGGLAARRWLTKLPMNGVTLEGFPISDESIQVLGSTNSLIGLSLRRTGFSD